MRVVLCKSVCSTDAQSCYALAGVISICRRQQPMSTYALRNDVIMTGNVLTAHYVTWRQPSICRTIAALLSSSAQIFAANYRLMATSTTLLLLHTEPHPTETAKLRLFGLSDLFTPFLIGCYRVFTSGTNRQNPLRRLCVHLRWFICRFVCEQDHSTVHS